MANGLEHLANDLNVALEEARSKEFRAEPYYDRDTDSLVFYERDVRSYAKRINKYLTIYLSCTDDTVVGFKIKGVQIIMRAVDGMGDVPICDPVPVNDGIRGNIDVAIIMRGSLMPTPEQKVRGSEFERLEHLAEKVRLQKSELCET